MNKQREERDAAICEAFQAGTSLADCGRQFNLTRQRIQQILKQAGLWESYQSRKPDRTAFVGINVSKPTKDALKLKAEEQGTTISKLASDAIDEMLKP